MPFIIKLTPWSFFELLSCCVIVTVSDIDEYPQHTKRTSKQGVSVIKTDIHCNPWDVFVVSSSNPETNELLEFVNVLDKGQYVFLRIACAFIFASQE